MARQLPDAAGAGLGGLPVLCGEHSRGGLRYRGRQQRPGRGGHHRRQRGDRRRYRDRVLPVVRVRDHHPPICECLVCLVCL